MQKRLIPTLLVMAALPVTAVAQEEMQHEKMEHAQMTHEHGVGMASIQPLYDQFKGWLIASAEQMPQEHYGFKPTADVRNLAKSSVTWPTRATCSVRPRSARPPPACPTSRK